MTTQPLTGSILGALKYNVNEFIGWRVTIPSTDEIMQYSDLYYQGSGYTDLGSDTALFKQYDEDNASIKKEFINAVSGGLTYNDTIYRNIVKEEDYLKMFGNGGLFGISFLPWTQVGLQTDDGQWYVKRTGGGNYVAVNPLRRDVLITKLMTVLKIAGPAAALWYGGKYYMKSRSSF